MKSLVRDVMTTEVVTVEPCTPFREIVARVTVSPTATATEAARRMHTAGISGCRWSTTRAGWSGSSAAPTS
jgi:hypothetical protein